jgi:hypothetical protein
MHATGKLAKQFVSFTVHRGLHIRRSCNSCELAYHKLEAAAGAHAAQRQQLHGNCSLDCWALLGFAPPCGRQGLHIRSSGSSGGSFCCLHTFCHEYCTIYRETPAPHAIIPDHQPGSVSRLCCWGSQHPPPTTGLTWLVHLIALSRQRPVRRHPPRLHRPNQQPASQPAG